MTAAPSCRPAGVPIAWAAFRRMNRFRHALCHLLAALLLCAGLPARAQAAACERGADAPMSCCVAKTDTKCPCEAPDRAADCGCKRRTPDPTPPPPLPKQPQVPDAGERPAAPRAPPAPEAQPTAALAAALAQLHGLLPRRSRQEALSVWRL